MTDPEATITNQLMDERIELARAVIANPPGDGQAGDDASGESRQPRRLRDPGVLGSDGASPPSLRGAFAGVNQ